MSLAMVKANGALYLPQMSTTNETTLLLSRVPGVRYNQQLIKY